MTTEMRTAPPRRVRRHRGTYQRRSWLRLIAELTWYMIAGMLSGAALLAALYVIALWLEG